MTEFIERENFSKRLHLALRKSGYNILGPTLLAREFNVRFRGNRISVHAVRKWLQGEAIPTQEKLRVLALWLGVTAEWLRFGGMESPAPEATPGTAPRFDCDDIRLLSDLQLLDKSHHAMAHEIVRLFMRMNIGDAASSA